MNNFGIQRNEKIDILKGFAIILMVMGHSMSDIEYMTIPFNVIYSFHMPILFYLSGYMIEATKSKYAQTGILYFIKRKAVSLLVPYFSWTVLVPWIYNRCSFEVLKNQLVSVTGLHGSGIWFLPVLFGLTLMYAFIWLLQKSVLHQKDSFAKDVVLLVISVMLLVMLVFITKHPYLVNMMSYAIPFFFGVFVAKYNFVKKIIGSRSIIVAAIGLYFVLFPFFDFYDTSVMTQVKRIILSIFAIIVLWNLCRKETYQNRILRFVMLCGKYSLAIYLIHGYFSRWKLILEARDSVLLGSIISLAGSVLVCIICVACAKILEMTKVTRKVFLGK